MAVTSWTADSSTGAPVRIGGEAAASAAGQQEFVTWRGKRALDVIVALGVLLVAAPLLLLIALAVKVSSPGPVLFRQRRVGRGGVEFPLLKFRSMRVDAQDQLRANPALQELFVKLGHKIPCHMDPRVTRVGRTLRRLSLDELPQLLNVVAGHMSLVGPRPVERTQFDVDYKGYEAAYLRLRPGITGLWQVSGRSTVQFPARAELDRNYAEGCCASLDARILARTPRVIVSGIGAD